MIFVLVVTNLLNVIAYTLSLSSAMENGLVASTTIAFFLTILISAALIPKVSEAALSPLFLLLLIHMYANVARLTALAMDESLVEQKYFLNAMDFDMLNSASVMVAIGTIAFVIGYLCTKLLPTSEMVQPKSLTFSKHRVWLVYAACIAVAYLIVAGSDNADLISAKRFTVAEDGSLHRFGPVRFALQIFLAALQILFCYYLLNAKNFKFHNLIAIVIFVIISLAISKRSVVLFAFIPFVVIYLTKINLSRMINLSVIAVLAVVSIFAVTSLRSEKALERLGSNESVFETAINLYTFTVISANYGGVIPTAMSSILIENETSPLVGRTYFIDPLAQFIPRTLWPTKPEELGGQIRIIHQDMGVAPSNITGGVPPGIFAEAWLNFGIPGVGLVCYIYGVLLGLLFRAIRREYHRKSALFGVFLFIGINATFFLYGGHVARTTMFITQLLIAYTLLRLTGVFRIRSNA